MRAALERLLEAVGEDAAREILAEAGRPGTLGELERVLLRRCAHKLLEDQKPRWYVRDRLLSRGLSRSTAYRVIDEVLGLGPRCVTPREEMGRDLRSIGQSQSPEPRMSLTLAHLTARRKQLQAELTALNLPGRRLAETNAQAKYERLKNDGRPLNDQQAMDERQAAAQEASGTRGARAGAECNAAPLHRELNELESMLGSAQAVESAEAERVEVKLIVTAAAEAAQKAEAAVKDIESLIATERAAFDLARTEAAANLLQAVKSGADVSKVARPNLDNVATLEMALATAKEELAAAQAAHQAAMKREAAIVQKILVAKAGVAALAHELARAKYVEVLAEYMTAHVRAHRTGCGTVDPRADAAALSQRQLDREGY